MAGAPRYRRKTRACTCRYCGETFLAANPKALVCEKDECQREKDRDADRRARLRRRKE